jgi:hypothetical protein
LDKKYEVKVNRIDLLKLLSTPNNFIPFLTDSQKEKFVDKKLNFTPSLIIEAIGKYFKATYKK